MDNVKLALCFRRVPLGVLERTGKGYRYTSTAANEQELREALAAHDYSLWGSFARESAALFPEFMGIIERCSRADICARAGISPGDCAWDKLVKLSRLDFFTPNLYVQPAPCDGEKEG